MPISTAGQEKVKMGFSSEKSAPLKERGTPGRRNVRDDRIVRFESRLASERGEVILLPNLDPLKIIAMEAALALDMTMRLLLLTFLRASGLASGPRAFQFVANSMAAVNPNARPWCHSWTNTSSVTNSCKRSIARA